MRFLLKVTKCKALGARVIQHGDDIGEAKAYADEVYVKEEGLRYVNGFDHPHIIAGQVSKRFLLAAATGCVRAFRVCFWSFYALP